MIPPIDQLALFDVRADARVPVGAAMDDSSALVSRSSFDWPRVETSACGRPGFWRPRTPAVFGVRNGVGPLLLFPDTAILISLHQELEELGAFTLYALWSDRNEPVDALRDLVQLWWWRDVRFLVSPTHLIDAQKPMTQHQKLARCASVRELGQDFYDRGGYEPIITDQGAIIEDRPCVSHSFAVAATPGGSAAPVNDPPLPGRGRDKQLVYEALAAGCHVFVTADKKILRCHKSFVNRGLAILSPVQLLENLDEAGELADCENPWSSPAPDISTLGRFYGAFASECFEDLEGGNFT